MKFLLIMSALLASLFCESMSETVSCETIGADTWFGESMSACYMLETTTINSEEFVISPADSSVQVIMMYGNKKIQFLPIQVDETFPNLVGYSAHSCSIKVVSKKNLENLNKLKRLHLNENQIERINSDTFEDLTSLEELFLYKNNIKKMDGATFRGLRGLTIVYLKSNVCIDKDYTTASEIATLPQEVDERCGFIMAENAPLKSQLQTALETAATLTAEILALKSQLKFSEDAKSTQQVEIASLKATLKAAEDAESEKQAENVATTTMKSQLVPNLSARQIPSYALPLLLLILCFMV